MLLSKKVKILKKLFSKKFLEETTFDKYVCGKKSNFGGSVVNDIERQFRDNRKKIETSINKAIKILHVKSKP